jgi:hypothetical protein
MSQTTAREVAEHEITKLEKSYSERMELNTDLTRALVSFQANKSEPIFRWFKYREGFSRDLVRYCLDHADVKAGDIVLDPFAGTGATVFTASERGAKGIGLELLPVGSFFMNFRQLVARTGPELLMQAVALLRDRPWRKVEPQWKFPHVRITEGAFPAHTELEMRRFKTWIGSLPNDVSYVLDFILFSVLEEISFTRKDGQYLRWDYRAERPRGKSQFDKGSILELQDAIDAKASRIEVDIAETVSNTSIFSQESALPVASGDVTIFTGTNFESLSQLKQSSVDFALSSPPYCNRYDYTRTYALELAYLGTGEDGIRKLRQELLTCTVENKPKSFELIDPEIIRHADQNFHSCVALQAILYFLQSEIDLNLLNNKGILTMVRGYFLESAVHLIQMARVIRSGGYYIMVNDNVQYNGLPIPVDCILSELAQDAGFTCERIWILPAGKGNSSQQMKRHGRTEIRKCVYVWKRR